MNVRLPEKEKMSKKRLYLYIICAVLCVFAIVIVIGIEILGNDIINNFFGISRITKRTEQEEKELKANFETILDNSLEYTDDYRIEKIEDDKELVYTFYKKIERQDKLELIIDVPYININCEEAKEFNKLMEDTFIKKAENILEETEKNDIYTIKYKAYIENDILSVIVYSNLKQELNAQRLIVKTFNYDLKEKSVLKLEEILKIYNLEKSKVQNKIDKDIKGVQSKIDELISLGYNMFSRDLDSVIYKIDNIEEYFIYNNNIYIIFAYGNDKLTTEIDIVII